jgi:pimeloyl-ACP methyl ester carboxylesterase
MLYERRQGTRLSQIAMLWMFSMLVALPAHGGEMSEHMSSNASRKTTFFFAENPGPQPVGLKVVEQYDYSRAFQPLVDDLGQAYRGETARPMQTLIWYPAQRVASKPMTVGQYIDLSATETSFGKPTQPLGALQVWFEGWNGVRADRMRAVRDAPFALGKFPVVVYAPSFSSWPWENADLCEFIASYGYVVISSPGMGVTRQSTHDVAGASAQAQDISFLIGYAHTLADADTSEVAVVGMSWGGLSNLFAAAHDNRIKALAALDGSMRYFPGLVKQAGDVVPERMTIPLLFFKGQSSLEDQAQLEATFSSAGPSVLNAWTHGDLISVQMLGFFHPEFLSMSQRNERLWQFDFPRWQQEADYGRQDGITGYAWVARYTQKFLDAYLKHNAAALSYLKNKPSENGVPSHVMAVKFRGAVPPPASFDSFKAEVGRRGFEHAPEVYASFQEREPNFKLDSDALSSWTYGLLVAGHPPEATDIAKLNVQLFPSGTAYSALAEVYAKSGQKEAAIDCYKRAVEISPENVFFRQRLDVLEAIRP